MCLQFAVKIFAFKTSLLTCYVIKLCQFLSDRFHLFRWRQSPKRTFVFLFFFSFHSIRQRIVLVLHFWSGLIEFFSLSLIASSSFSNNYIRREKN